jgi:hypothetical protein
MSDLETCPSCSNALPSRLKSGRVVCPKCGWTDQPKKTVPELVQKVEVFENTSTDSMSKNIDVDEEIKNRKRLRTFWYGAGTFLLVLGGWMMTAGFFYDPSVESGDIVKTRTYNIGEISQRSTLTNTGGFLAVCGSIIITRSRKQETT